MALFSRKEKRGGTDITANQGEVDQVYVEDHHDPIIEPSQWELVQIEIARRKELRFSYNCTNTFSSKLICGDCGKFYGQKVWHSTTNYRKQVYQCNDKFNKSHKKCETPTLTEEIIVKKFLEAYSKFMKDRTELVSDCKEMIEILNNTIVLEKEIEQLTKKDADIIVLIENLINKNATVPMHQDEFQSTYDEYDKEHERLLEQVEKDENLIQEKNAKAKYLQAFIHELESQPLILEEWDEDVWSYLIDKATVNKDRTITFLFRNGKEITVD